MPHWKEMTDRDYLFAFDLKGKDCTVTIARIEAGTITGTGGKKNRKPLAYFKEASSGKPLGLNATNCKAISALYGTDTDGWVGKRITLYPTTTNFGGEVVECIRVRPKVPDAPKRGAPSPTDDNAEPPEPGSDG